MQRLVAIREEYLAVQQAVRQVLLNTSRKDYAHLERAYSNLESAYLARLFSEFEGILKDYLLLHDARRRPPKNAYDRIFRVAKLLSIPDAIYDEVQEAREFRNSVVHPGGIQRPSITLSSAHTRLCKFLAPLL